jgi:hypothetical protein
LHIFILPSTCREGELIKRVPIDSSYQIKRQEKEQTKKRKQDGFSTRGRIKMVKLFPNAGSLGVRLGLERGKKQNQVPLSYPPARSQTGIADPEISGNFNRIIGIQARGSGNKTRNLQKINFVSQNYIRKIRKRRRKIDFERRSPYYHGRSKNETLSRCKNKKGRCIPKKGIEFLTEGPDKDGKVIQTLKVWCKVEKGSIPKSRGKEKE